MKKFITPTYTFTPGASGVGTINLSGITGFNVKNLVSIINQTKGVVIYATGSQSLKYTNVTGTTVTLFADTTGMSAGDTLQIIYEDNSALAVEPTLVDKLGNEFSQLATYSGGTAVGNSVSKFRDGFVLAAPDLNVWDQQWINQADSFVAKGGEANGSSYLNISLSPFQLNSEYRLISKESFNFPVVLGFAYSASQKISGQEFEVGLVGTDNNGNVEYITAIPDVALPNSIIVSSNVATITFATPHSFKSLDRVVLHNNTNSYLNVGPVVVTVVTELQITVPIIAPSTTYTGSNGFIKFADPMADAYNSVALHTGDSQSNTAMNYVCRRNGSSYKNSSIQTASSFAVSISNSNFTESFNSANNNEIIATSDDVVAVSRVADSIATPATPVRFSQTIPDEGKKYKIFIRAKNHARLPRPIARIVSATKSGSTTVTIVTDVAHNLVTNTSRIAIYGIRDITNFPNISTATIVTVINATTFTVTQGSAASIASSGGFVVLADSNTTISSIPLQNVQSISRTNNLLSITFNSTVGVVSLGQTIHLYGCNATSMGLFDGAYKIRRINSAVLIVDSVGADFASINCGGSVILRSDFRVHSVRLNDYLRHNVEMNSNGFLDTSKGLPVSGTVAVSNIASGTVTINGGNVAVDGGYIDGINDFVNVIGTVNIGNTVATYKVNNNLLTSNLSGTLTASTFFYGDTQIGDCLSLSIACSSASGTSYVHVYNCPDNETTYTYLYSLGPITTSGNFTTPILRMATSYYALQFEPTSGSSATINSFETFSNFNPDPIVKYSTRNINLNLVSSATAAIRCDSVKNFQLMITVSAQTTAATVALEFSNNGVNWFTSGATVTTTLSTFAKVNIQNEQWSYVRAKVTSAGSGITISDLTIKGMV